MHSEKMPSFEYFCKQFYANSKSIADNKRKHDGAHHPS